jgi:CheY-like chemotaxis protein
LNASLSRVRHDGGMTEDDPASASTSSAVTAEQLGTLSHEFRTPLNGVLGMARLLEATRLTAEQRSYVTALRQSGDHLLSLVNDVLDFTRLGAGGLDLHISAVDPQDLLRQVAELMSPRAHEKGLEIAWAAAPDLGPFMADEGRLRQVLLNFAGNAIKFTTSGGVLLLATRGPEGRVRLSVQDTGPGVPVAARDRIFRPFVQVEAAHGSQLGGAGLGLAVVDRLARAMESTVGVTDASGGGAEFFFEGRFPAAGDPAMDAGLSGLAVGVASPNPVICDAAARQIIASGGRPVIAADIETLLSRAPPEAVLLIDERLSSTQAPVQPPPGRAAIVLLAPEERGLIAPRRAAGFAGYLIKPLRQESLTARVRAALAAGPAEDHPSGEDDRIAPSTAKGARVLLAEDNPINAMLARILLEREGAQVERVTTGIEAVNALGAGRYDLVLMDLRMPGLDGMAATRALRAKGVTTPVVALTADAFEDDRRACLAAGMDDFLVKPLTPDSLRSVLLRWTGPARPVKLAL